MFHRRVMSLLYSVLIRGSFRMFPESLYLNYISFKIVPLCKYTLLPATVNVLETFMEAIL